MQKVKVELNHEVINGQPITFVAPCDCSEVTGLKVSYPGGVKEFDFKDSHGNDLTGISELFLKGAYVRVIVDTVNSNAFIQNADTNAYLESQLASKRPNTWTPTAEEVGARPNTWTPTAEGVGAAPAIESAEYPGCYYRLVNGIVEWINPPLIPNVEYRLTKRLYGIPVYKQVLLCGTLTGGYAFKFEVPEAAGGALASIVSTVYQTVDGIDWGSHLPELTKTNVDFTNGAIWWDMKDVEGIYTGVITVEYTKPV